MPCLAVLPLMSIRLSIKMDYDASTGWEYVVNPETVTLKVKTGEGQYTDQVVEYAKRRKVDKDLLIGMGLLATNSITFHLWAVKLNGTVPKIGDEVFDLDGDYWVIKLVSVESLAQRYKCVCKQVPK